MASTDEMLRIYDYEVSRDHKDEYPFETQARQEMESAKNRLDRVKTAKDAGGNLWYSWEDRTEAQNAFKEKFDAHRKAANDGARQQRLDKEAAEKKVRDDRRAAEVAKQTASYEVETRQAYRQTWKGDEASFNRAWPGMWEQHLVTDAQEQMKQNRAAIMTHNVYSKF